MATLDDFFGKKTKGNGKKYRQAFWDCGQWFQPMYKSKDGTWHGLNQYGQSVFWTKLSSNTWEEFKDLDNSIPENISSQKSLTKERHADKRTAQVLATRKFLLDLADSKIIKGIPKQIRSRASLLLLHYPTESCFSKDVDISWMFEQI